MKQKKYKDIKYLVEESDNYKERNCNGFRPGDIIQITEEFDGCTTSIALDDETKELQAFSRNQQITEDDSINGFYSYVKSLSNDILKEHPSWFVFGKWSKKHKIVYKDSYIRKHWYVIDIYDTETREWLLQDRVKAFCDEAGLEYIHVLYEGEFISWEHCRSFLNKPFYGEHQKGIVIKNQTTLNSTFSHADDCKSYLRITNDQYRKVKKPRVRSVKAQFKDSSEEALRLASSLITEPKVEKMMFVLRDEHLLHDNLTKEDLTLISKVLPKRLIQDCEREGGNIVASDDEVFYSLCRRVTMQHAKTLVAREIF